jgi:hypothetical protein
MSAVPTTASATGQIVHVKTTNDILDQTCKYRFYHHHAVGEKNKCNCAASIILSYIGFGISLSQRFVKNPSSSSPPPPPPPFGSRALSHSQLKLLGFDYAWEVHGIFLDDTFKSEDFENMVLKLRGYHHHCFLKRLEIGHKHSFILDQISQACSNHLLPHLEEISISENDLEVESAMRHSLESVSGVSGGCMHTTIGDINSVKTITTLTKLSCPNSTIQGDLFSFANLNRLKYLNLEETSVHGNLDSISLLTSLTHLYFKKMPSVRGHLSSLKQLKNLVYIELSENEKNIHGSIESLSELKLLEKLRLHWCSNIDGNISCLWENNLKLKFVDLTHTRVRGCITSLVTLRGLTNVYISRTFVDKPSEKEIEELVAACPHVKNVFFRAREDN